MGGHDGVMADTPRDVSKGAGQT